jgi:mono/diheme cytochrome c family protein
MGDVVNGRHGMKFLLLAAGFVWAATILAAPAGAQEARQEGREAGPQNPGRAVVLSKCFQCHTDAMFRDQRQDRRAWESTIYRMIGRGALWTPEEIKLMADYLGTDYGITAKPAAAPR